MLNTAFMERLNGTFRARLAPLVRRTRALARQPETIEGGMFLVGCVYISARIIRACVNPSICPATGGGGCNARRLWPLD